MGSTVDGEIPFFLRMIVLVGLEEGDLMFGRVYVELGYPEGRF